MYLSAKQGKCSIREYVHDLRFLASCVTKKSSLWEDNKVNIFMNGLNDTAARTQLFRTYLLTFEDAVRIAFAKDFSVTQTRRVKPSSLPLALGALPLILKRARAASILADREMEVLNTLSAYPASDTLILCRIGRQPSRMLSFSSRIPGYERLFLVLVDCGASENYARRASIQENRSIYDDSVQRAPAQSVVRVKTADGQVVTLPNVVVALATVVEGFAFTEPFYVIDLDDRWDLIVGMR
ncbi:hypothetical protein H310_15004 [Aphanomyces invadans]|uniref:Retrotransposon gag domain-containing protein n=1 Tax=Aphanomyces invadans TaxID=157072 RepID=A0A024T7Z2_9STRA|nr:hypothetical protein H310_15004 [Aphanomyces invadans]ETV90160.1 hypothetical protein H310_15004 [Aphanomyces invadans]|eukprot:XP_008881206.1 hypothetical protein H310_15004 [Aphanomyces invadans]